MSDSEVRDRSAPLPECCAEATRGPCPPQRKVLTGGPSIDVDATICNLDS